MISTESSVKNVLAAAEPGTDLFWLRVEAKENRVEVLLVVSEVDNRSLGDRAPSLGMRCFRPSTCNILPSQPAWLHVEEVFQLRSYGESGDIQLSEGRPSPAKAEQSSPQHRNTEQVCRKLRVSYSKAHFQASSPLPLKLRRGSRENVTELAEVPPENTSQWHCGSGS